MSNKDISCLPNRLHIYSYILPYWFLCSRLCYNGISLLNCTRVIHSRISKVYHSLCSFVYLHNHCNDLRLKLRKALKFEIEDESVDGYIVIQRVMSRKRSFFGGMNSRKEGQMCETNRGQGSHLNPQQMSTCSESKFYIEFELKVDKFKPIV